MTFTEILTKIAGLDRSKDYNLVLDEIKTEPSVPVEPTQPEKHIVDKPGVDNSSTVETAALLQQIEALTSEVTSLKELNKHLALHTPAEPEKSVEQRIFELCAPTQHVNMEV